MDAGITGLIGAGVGAVGTALTAAVTGLLSRSQMKMQIQGQLQQAEQQFRADAIAQRRQFQRDAYGEALRVMQDLLQRKVQYRTTIREADEAAMLRGEMDGSDQAAEAAELNAALTPTYLDAPTDMHAAGREVMTAFTGAQGALLAWAIARLQATTDGEVDTAAAAQRSTADSAIDRLQAAILRYTIMVSDFLWSIGTEPLEDGVARRAFMTSHLLNETECGEPTPT